MSWLYAGCFHRPDCTSEAATLIFPNQHIERWAFDVELLFLATRQGVPLIEVRPRRVTQIPLCRRRPCTVTVVVPCSVSLYCRLQAHLLRTWCAHATAFVQVPVEWEEVDGSKVDMLADTLSMARDLVLIRLCYLLGIWTYEKRKRA